MGQGLRLMFVGASGTVPGSHYVVSEGNNHYALDMGGIPQRNSVLENKISSVYPLPFNLKAVIATHGHFDHIGKLPKFIEEYGFRGPIYGTLPTLELLKQYMGKKAKFDRMTPILKNVVGGDIGIEEKQFLELEPRNPDTYDDALFLPSELRVENIKEWFDQGVPSSFSDMCNPINFHKHVPLTENLNFELLKASHIIGSSQVLLNYKGEKGINRILFTGDIGYQNCFFGEPEIPDSIDSLVFDSTNCDKDFDSDYDPREEIKQIINKTINRGGQAYFAAFTVNRMQMIMNFIKDLHDKKEIPDVPYFVDSPTGSKLFELYKNHSEFLEGVDDASFIINERYRIGKSSRKSKAIVKKSFPYVVISASGMFTEGRILNYLTKKGENRGIEDERNSVVICGYQAEEVGRTILSAKDSNEKVKVKITKGRGRNWSSNFYDVNAEVHELKNLSGHMYRDQAYDWIQKVNPKNLFLVHADHKTRKSFKDYLVERAFSGDNIYLPHYYSFHDIK
ncbi:hypothetical protein C0585_00225 [Candidatus Woesearchaeota archaeon]|nr:MAG: hypothetical protein C0585_00225 [Candidatus Woesearchaeota archaeon]